MPKNNKKQKKFEHKTASPAKGPKCRYDFVAFPWRIGLICSLHNKHTTFKDVLMQDRKYRHYTLILNLYAHKTCIVY